MNMTWWLGAAVLGTGCIVEDPGKDLGTVVVVTDDPTDDTGLDDIDADKDGFPQSIDCNDGDPLINPDAVEACDGIDNDCSTVADDGEGVASISQADGATLYATLNEAIADGIQFQAQVDLCEGATVPTLELDDGDALTINSVAGRDATSLSVESGQTFARLTGDAALTLIGVTVTGSVERAFVLDGTSSLTLRDAAVTANPGGGVLIPDRADGVTLLVQGSNFENNAVPSGLGGAIRAEGRAFVITVEGSEANASRFAANGADRGGAIALVFRGGSRVAERVLAITSDTTFVANVATVSGGAIDSVGGTIDLDSVTLDANITAGLGGALNLSNTSVTVANTTLSNNEAAIGGAVSLDATGFSSFSASTNVSIVDNVATDAGGGISGSGFVGGVFVARNQAALGGGVYVPDPGFLLLEDTSLDDNLALQGGGLFLGANTVVDLLDVSLTLNRAVPEFSSEPTSTGMEPEPLPLPDVVEPDFVGLGGAAFLTDGAELEALSSDFGVDNSELGGADTDNRPGDVYLRALGVGANHEQLGIDMDVVCDDAGCLLIQSP